MDEKRNEIGKEKKSDKLKTPIRIYMLIMVFVTLAAAVVGTAVYVTPVVGTIGSVIGFDIDDVVKAGDLIGENAVKWNNNISSGKGSLDSFEIETGNWDREGEEEITGISVDVNCINLTIRSGKTLGAEWECKSIFVPDVRVDGNTLRITQKDENNLSFLLGNSLDLSKLAANLVLTVPEDMYLEDLNIDVDAGNIVITDVKSRKTEMKADLGNIVLTGGDFGTLEVEADCGNVELFNDVAESAEIEADLGRVVVTGSSIGSLKVQADCGEIDINGIVSEEVDLKADCGSISASGEFDALTADCSLGSISVMTVKPESEVWMKLHADLGDVTVNGKKW